METPPTTLPTMRPTGVGFIRVVAVGGAEVEGGEGAIVVIVTAELGVPTLGTISIPSKMNKFVSFATVTNISSV